MPSGVRHQPPPGPTTKCIAATTTTPSPAADPLARLRTLFNTDILFTSASGEQQTMDLLPGLAQVQCPVLVLAGTEDPVTPLVDAQEIAAAIPSPWGRLVSIADAGHGTWRDQPEEAMRVLRDFVLSS